MGKNTQLLHQIKRDEGMLHDKTNRRYSIEADLNIVIDGTQFHLNADGSAVILHFEKLTDAGRLVGKINSVLLRHVGPDFSLHDFLTQNGITVYVRNKHFGFIGQRANKFFLGMSRVAIKLLVGKEQ